MMEHAETLLLKHAQHESFSNDMGRIRKQMALHRTSRLLKLSPVLDQHGLLRVGGRIDAAADVALGVKRPVILDGCHPVARLNIRHYHIKAAHGSQEMVVNDIKQKYWILRLYVKLVTSLCMLCRIMKSKPQIPRMGDLPQARVAHHRRPFFHCGLDLFGPMEVAVGLRRKKKVKMSGVVKQFPVEKEYLKNPDISPEDIQKLREWVKTQPHLPEKYLDDLDLLVTFHCCENSAEVAKQVLDLHFTLRTLFTCFFKDRCFDKKAEYSLETVVFAPLPMPLVRGYRGFYARLRDPDPRHFNFNDVVRTFMMVFDLWQCEEGTWPGFELIVDLDTAVVGHLARVDLMSLRQVLYFLQEAMLVKLKAVHFLNAPNFMDKLMLMLKPFLKKELLELISIHQRGSDSVYKYIPKAALPKDGGGDYKDFETIKEELLVRLQSNTVFFRDENRRRVDEALRRGKKATVEDLFGIQGSFKKLDID